MDNKIFDTIHPPQYDEYRESTEELTHNGMRVGFTAPKITVKELKQQAKQLGIKGYYRMRWSDLIIALNK